MTPLHRELEILRRTVDALDAAPGESDLLSELCRVVYEAGGFPLVWFGYAEVAPPYRVVPVSMAGPATAYLEGADIRWSASPQGQGPTGSAIREARVVVARRLRRDPRFGPWRARAREFGLESSAAVPILVGGTVAGVLNVYAHTPDAFDAAETTLLATLGKLVGLGLRRARERASAAATTGPRDVQVALAAGLLELVPDMVFVHRPDGPVVAVNDRVLTTYQCTRQDIFEGDPTQFSGVPEATPRLLRAVLRAAQGEPIDLRWIGRRKDGTTFPCEVRLRRLDLPAFGDEPYVLAFVRDVSPEEELRQRELDEHTADTASDLAATLAHDFNNLLMGVGGHLDSALACAGPAPRPALEAAREATRRAQEITRRLQHVGRPRPLRPRPCSLAETVAVPARFAAHGAPVTLHLSLDESVGPLLVDPSAMERIVHNLVLNAAQALDGPGNIWIEARAAGLSRGEPPHDPIGTVEIHIDDDGPGVPPRHRGKLFTPHFSTKARGSGLGLASSHRLAQRLGGALRFSPSPRGGARFTLTVPHADSLPDSALSTVVDSTASTPGAPTPPRATAGHREAPDTPPLRALVVDDDQTLRAVVVRLLQHDGYLATSATCGADAVAQARRARETGAPPDVAIVDLSLGGGGPEGAALAQELRQVLPRLGVVLSSAWKDAPEMLTPEAHGFDAALPKPFRRRELQEAVSKALFRARSRPEFGARLREG